MYIQTDSQVVMLRTTFFYWLRLRGVPMSVWEMLRNRPESLCVQYSALWEIWQGVYNLLLYDLKYCKSSIPDSTWRLDAPEGCQVSRYSSSHRKVTSLLPVGRNTVLCQYWLYSVYYWRPLFFCSLLGGEVHAQHFVWKPEMPHGVARWCNFVCNIFQQLFSVGVRGLLGALELCLVILWVQKTLLWRI